jgi:penicillin-binding protein 2
MRFFGIRRKSRLTTEINPDEILIDASNVADFDRDQFEGRIERPLGRKTLVAATTLIALLFVAYIARAGTLQLIDGEMYAERAKNNQLAQRTIFADRGIIEDRNGVPLAYNKRESVADDYAQRVYIDMPGLAHVIGFAQAPAKDSGGTYYRTQFIGMDGAEKAFNDMLGGKNGLKLTETDARDKVVSESTIQPPQSGDKLTLSIDANVTSGLYEVIAKRAQEAHAIGGAGLIMDVRTGELLALTSYPEYSPNAMVEGDKDAIRSYNTNKNQPFLDRAVDGLYSPGSIIKPIMAAAALQEGVITEHTTIVSTGQISIPNPYNPSKPTVFRDWRVNGILTVRDAVAVSSDVFFYEVGGGFKNQPGIGIANIEKYFRMFGYGSDAGLTGFSYKTGTIPSPTWKAENFPDDPTWRVGNTYHTAIGQYGMQVTPLQAVREAVAVANGGYLLKPTLLANAPKQNVERLPIDPYNLQVAREGMRQGVKTGIATAINFPFIQAAAKTGTAEVGVRNEYQNAWMIGFWPYDEPKYAFAVVLEKMPSGTPVGGASVMYDFFQWMNSNAPQYLK